MSIATEKINDARIAVVEYNVRRVAAEIKLDALLKTWESITSDLECHVAVIIETRDEDYLQLEDSAHIWKTYEKYDRKNSKEAIYSGGSVARLQFLTTQVETAILTLPKMLAANTLKWDVSC